MTRTFLTLFMGATLALAACKKNDADAPNSDYVLKGLSYFDPNGTAAGMTGTPDDSARLDTTELNVYPTLVNRFFYLHINSRKSGVSTSSFTYKVVHAIYPNAPDSLIMMSRGYSGRYPVIVENGNLVGQEVIHKTSELDGDIDWHYKSVGIDMQNQPKGFYRLFIETNTGTRLRMGLYKY